MKTHRAAQNHLRPIGILGGMGPEATILLQHRVLAAVPARDDADHIPLMIDMNPQVPSRIAHLIDATELAPDPAPVLAGMARRLEQMGAAALAMPCNTAHGYADAIRAAVTIPFLDMVALTVAACTARMPQGGRIGMLASAAVPVLGMFDRALADHGLVAVWPDDTTPLLASIRSIKAHGVTKNSTTGLLESAEMLRGTGVDTLLIACTEFSLASRLLAGPVPVIDALDILADAIVATSIAPVAEEKMPCL